MSQMYVHQTIIPTSDAGTDDSQFGDWDDDEDEDNGCYLIHLLRSGLPCPPEAFIEQDMCTPVFPNTKHPSREPVIPNKPLPVSWKDCYLASFETVNIRSPVEWKMWDVVTGMSENARGMHFDNFWTDERRMEHLDPTPQSPCNLAPIVENSAPHVMPIRTTVYSSRNRRGFHCVPVYLISVT